MAGHIMCEALVQSDQDSNYTLKVLGICVQLFADDSYGAVGHASLICIAGLMPVLPRGNIANFPVFSGIKVQTGKM